MLPQLLVVRENDMKHFMVNITRLTATSGRLMSHCSAVNLSHKSLANPLSLLTFNIYFLGKMNVLFERKMKENPAMQWSTKPEHLFLLHLVIFTMVLENLFVCKHKFCGINQSTNMHEVESLNFLIVILLLIELMR